MEGLGSSNSVLSMYSRKILGTLFNSEVRRRSDMNDGFLPAFLAKWTRMRERYLADPNDHGIKHARL